MVNISLRDYYKEIDSLITTGESVLAVDHCIHILTTYPKDFETYRLLGKALIETKEMAQAADIFGRALAIHPDDYVANVGMSCIREEEGNIDAAIWHMERAFELDSSNSAVQSELIRLYSFRDGEAPPKIRLTKGALVRMYAKGGMLQQAISEILLKFSSLDERPDIQALLANLYCQTGQIDAARNLCHKLLIDLPYCFDANFILLNYPDSSPDNPEIAIHRERLVEINPYYAFLENFSLDVLGVPDDAVMLAKFTPVEANLEADSNKIPAWFSEEPEVSLQPVEDAFQPEPLPIDLPKEIDTDFNEANSSQEITAASAPELSKPSDMDLPEWMKFPDIADDQQENSSAGVSEPVADSDALPADIPEWIQGMAPPSAEIEEEIIPPLKENEDLSPVLFTENEVGEHLSDSPLNELPAWSSEDIMPSLATDSVEEISEIPEWLQGFDPSQTNAITPDLDKSLPAWLDEDEAEVEIPINKPFTLDDITELRPNAAFIPSDDELAVTGPLPMESLSNLEKPEWLKETQAESDIKALFTPTGEQPGQVEDSNDWLAKFRIDSEAPPQAAAFPDQPDIPEWLRESQEETREGDTEPVFVNPSAAQPGADMWIPEHSNFSNPPLPDTKDPEIPDLEALFNEIPDHEKLMAESSPDSDEISASVLPFPKESIFEESGIQTPIASDENKDLSSLLDHFSQKIHSGADLPAVLEEVKKLSKDYPSEPGVWLLLGDAYHLNKQIQAALDAYSRAEEFLCN